MYISLMLIIQVVTIYSAPLKFHLQPFEMAHKVQNIQFPLVFLRQQLLEQRVMQPISAIPTITQGHQVQPFIILLPDFEDLVVAKNKNIMTSKRINDRVNTDDVNNDINNNTDEDDSITIDADKMEPMPDIGGTHKVTLLLPNGRFSIGGLIGAIPFLPLEINVPDTISWAYNGIANGISGIISIIGQRLPLQNINQDSQENGLNLKTATSGFTNQFLSKPLVLIAV